jgi:hypothetical protein
MKQHGYFDLKLVEERAEGKPIGSVTVHYESQKEVTYDWDGRSKINWQRVTRCRLNFKTPKIYIQNGDACSRPGFRIRGHT